MHYIKIISTIVGIKYPNHNYDYTLQEHPTIAVLVDNNNQSSIPFSSINPFPICAIPKTGFTRVLVHEVFAFSHGTEIASKLLGSTPHDQLLIETSDSFSGLLLFAVGILLFMVAFVKDRDFQSFFAKGCVLLHIAMAIWRIYFERKLEELGRDWLRLVFGDFVLALSWVLFLVYSWREKYD
ncbi:hypothetical protein HanXRQr2_Chr07g0307311 [Helianthus annuus]|uniref:DUF7865 domain-containing protein n=1 Tax=Helianthus annuus TaxID=4232 RepID=A0A9K3IMQ9_HELAN|nr:hypothetical protein HanXRQr2_Chr07g0307311 [Helianthus annuus]